MPLNTELLERSFKSILKPPKNSVKCQLNTVMFFTLYDEDTKDFSQTYSGTASPLALRSLESSLQFRNCFSKGILDKDDLVLHMKLKHSCTRGCAPPAGTVMPAEPSPRAAQASTSPDSTQLPRGLGAKQEPGTIVLSPTSQEHTRCSLLVLNSSRHLQGKAGLLQVAVTQ